MLFNPHKRNGMTITQNMTTMNCKHFYFYSSRRFFGFGGPTKKKPSTSSTAQGGQGLMTQVGFKSFLIEKIFYNILIPCRCQVHLVIPHSHDDEVVIEVYQVQHMSLRCVELIKIPQKYPTLIVRAI